MNARLRGNGVLRILREAFGKNGQTGRHLRSWGIWMFAQEYLDVFEMTFGYFWLIILPFHGIYRHSFTKNL